MKLNIYFNYIYYFFRIACHSKHRGTIYIFSWFLRLYAMLSDSLVRGKMIAYRYLALLNFHSMLSTMLRSVLLLFIAILRMYSRCMTRYSSTWSSDKWWISIVLLLITIYYWNRMTSASFSSCFVICVSFWSFF